MNVVTWFGTRPEIIRLSRVIAALDPHCSQRLVHTGQNYDASLSDIFFRELGVRAPDVNLGITANDFGTQAGAIIENSHALLERERPDRLLILGDTNSGLAAVSAARLGIPVYHMEAGNRCYDDRVPEEVNRRIIDHSSTILMPYTQRSKDNLVREGIPRQRIAVIGNPIHEVLEFHREQIDSSSILETLGVKAKEYCLATLHRAENVDDATRLRSFMEGLGRTGSEVIVSVHPRTHDKLQRFGIGAPAGVRLIQPLGFFDFVKLEKNARCVLSDSGTVQEECCIFGVPNVTLRDVTERAETIECGSAILTGATPGDIERAIKIALDSVPWRVPPEYLEPNVSQTVVKVVLGFGI
jgi:UDP-N-acetylglucosamine 2-epimerase (non-hydrolysing)